MMPAWLKPVSERGTLSPRIQATESAQKYLERAGAVALLLLIHAMFISLLLNAKMKIASAPQTGQEILLPLVIQPARPLKPERESKRPKSNRAPPQLHALPPRFSTPEAQPDLTGVGQALFDCDLGNLAGMSPEARAKCPQSMTARTPPGTIEAGMPKKTLALQGDRWAASIVARQKPSQVPCVSLEQGPVSPFGGQKPSTTVMTDPLCALNGLINGFGGPK
jgi:hypothetical protein